MRLAAVGLPLLPPISGIDFLCPPMFFQSTLWACWPFPLRELDHLPAMLIRVNEERGANLPSAPDEGQSDGLGVQRECPFLSLTRRSCGCPADMPGRLHVCSQP